MSESIARIGAHLVRMKLNNGKPLSLSSIYACRAVIPETAWLKLEMLVREREREKYVPDKDGPLQHPVRLFGRDGVHEDLDTRKLLERICTSGSSATAGSFS